MFSWNWYAVKDGDARAYYLMTHHYTFHPYKDGRRSNLANRNRHLICGPGEKLVLITVTCDALFIWRKFEDDSGQVGVNCAVFRNEGEILSSSLILEAEQLAWLKWPGERLYTYVNPRKIRTGKPRTGRPFPGKCFIKAGWTDAGLTKEKKLIILEKYPFELAGCLAVKAAVEGSNAHSN